MNTLTKMIATMLSVILFANNIYLPFFQTTVNDINSINNVINEKQDESVTIKTKTAISSIELGKYSYKIMNPQENENDEKQDVNIIEDASDSTNDNEVTEFIPNTLQLMREFDYLNDSTTGLYAPQMTLQEMNKKYKKYGTLHTKGMPYDEYKEAMTYEWTDCTDYEKEIVPVEIDITKTINYSKYIDILQKLSRYDGVYLYKIGKSFEGRDLYAIEIDVESEKKKNVYMLTGQVHAREFAGGTFIIKMFADLIQDAQTNKKTMEMLKENKYVAIPIINVDGREALINEPKKWSENGELLKAYTNLTDGNRNFPGLMCGQLSKGNKLKWNISKKPSLFNYPGDYVGSNPETKAVMKWLYHYIVVEQAECLLDMHQQGSVIYAGKKWITKEQDKYSNDLRKKMFSHVNKGNTGRTYGRIKDEPKYGLEGTNSTITDYAMSIACGAKFSPSHGFCVVSDEKMDFILMQFNDLDDLKFKIEPSNPTFATLTIEIGVGEKYLGNSSETRKLLTTEYSKYHFDTMLYKLPGMIK